MDLPPSIVRLVGVYDADGTVVGELSYFLKARLGAAHCALCDITHGALRERLSWRERRSALPVPFDTVHRDEQPRRLRDDLGGAGLPFVAAELDDGRSIVLLARSELEDCDGSPERLVDAIESAVDRARPRLQWAS